MIKSTSLCLSMSSTFRFVIKNEISYPFTGTLLKITNASARIIKNLVNLCARICSISSACLILMENRTELIDGSIRTCSEALRAMTRGVRRTSGVEPASISGTLWRSATWEAKGSRVRAAVREERTAERYGRRVLDCEDGKGGELCVVSGRARKLD